MPGEAYQTLALFAAVGGVLCCLLCAALDLSEAGERWARRAGTLRRRSELRGRKNHESDLFVAGLKEQVSALKAYCELLEAGKKPGIDPSAAAARCELDRLGVSFPWPRGKFFSDPYNARVHLERLAPGVLWGTAYAWDSLAVAFGRVSAGNDSERQVLLFRDAVDLMVCVGNLPFVVPIAQQG